MELCADGELFDRIIAKGHYSECVVARLCQHKVTVVHDFHMIGVFHRDFKPENFFFLSIDEDSPLKATRFGLSVFFKSGDVLRDIVGSVYYVAPEGLHRHYERQGWDYTGYNLFYNFVLVIIFCFKHFNFPNFVLQLVY
ncbi:unnamed protein product [Lactuca saligna]|uniref:Protein kinase domain-containing protein n=1 Tax=Lactuca saligna TaxID=75948 RepID=A0AA35V2I9_LACSI|nr:unnamed protein product [Lactuca saligna]